MIWKEAFYEKEFLHNHYGEFAIGFKFFFL